MTVQIRTSYFTSHRTGAGKIRAVVTSGPNRGRYVTEHYDHALGHGSHEFAAAKLADYLGYDGVEYVGTSNSGADTFNVKGA